MVKSKNVSIVDVQDMAGKLLLNKLLHSGQRHLLRSSSLPVHLKDRIMLLSQTVKHPQGIGQGGLMSYRKTMTWELPKSKRGIRLIPTVAWNTGIKENSLDLVLDRGTWPFILNQGTNSGKNFLSDSIKHYLRILRPGGKVVFMLPEFQVEEQHEPTLRKNLKELLDQKQVHVRETPLENLHAPYPSHKLTYAGYKYATAIVVTKLREKMTK